MEFEVPDDELSEIKVEPPLPAPVLVVVAPEPLTAVRIKFWMVHVFL